MIFSGVLFRLTIIWFFWWRAQILKIIRSEIWNIRKQRRIRNVCLSPVSWKSARSFVACLLADVAQQWFLTPLLNLANFVFLLSFSSLFWFLSLCFFECLYIVDVGTSNLWKKSHQLTISFDSRLFFVSLIFLSAKISSFRSPRANPPS